MKGFQVITTQDQIHRTRVRLSRELRDYQNRRKVCAEHARNATSERVRQYHEDQRQHWETLCSSLQHNLDALDNINPDLISER